MEKDFVIAWRLRSFYALHTATFTFNLYHLVISYDKPTTHPDVPLTGVEMVTPLNSMNTHFVPCKLRLLNIIGRQLVTKTLFLVLIRGPLIRFRGP